MSTWVYRSAQMLSCGGRGESRTQRHRLPTMHVSGTMLARLHAQQSSRGGSAAYNVESPRVGSGTELRGGTGLRWLEGYRQENSAEATIQVRVRT